MVAVMCEGHPVSLGTAQMWFDGELDRAWIHAYVAPAEQGRGYGRAAFEGILEHIPTSRCELVTSVIAPGPAPDDDPSRRCAEHLGFRVANSVIHQWLRVPPNLTPTACPPGYHLSTHVDGVPLEDQESLGVLMGRVSAEAQRDLEWEPVPVSPVDYRRLIVQQTADGSHTVETIVRTGSGFVGCTSLLCPPSGDAHALQGGTLVLRQHGGRGLGTAMKRANLARLGQMAQLTTVVSSVDRSNASMLGLNRSLGFTDVETECQLVRAR